MVNSTNQNQSSFQGTTTGGSLSGFELRASPLLGNPSKPDSPLGFRRGRTKADETFPEESSVQKCRKSLKTKEFVIPGSKRALDIACVLLTIPLWLPVMIVISGWIKMTSSGPVFFRQTRLGVGTKPFTMLKFRSMKVGAETKTHEVHFRSLVENGMPMTKLDSFQDNRVIPGGRLLRVTGLDELPQVFNVLRGEMSLVGPRPCTPNELEYYIGWQRARFNVPPGITGYWQVNGKNKTTFNQMVEMDIQYGERMSLLFDVIIIFGTVPALAIQVMEARWQLTGRRSASAESTTAEIVSAS